VNDRPSEKSEKPASNGRRRPIGCNLVSQKPQAVQDYQDRTLRNLTCQRIQVDEIWACCYAKAKNVPPDMRGQKGVVKVKDV
jgi:hypothetical protein